jgi:2-polyprenyl-6-methoxyphenol hydroxylase-like FAD-dependent oxidoreductase
MEHPFLRAFRAASFQIVCAMDSSISAQCCIAGGGPAGMMLGFLLARAGVDVVVLEKHKDFFRDFRGDTIHPSTLELMYELDLLEEFLRLPHQELRQIQAHFGDEIVTVADFTHLPTHCQFIAFMPQWDFLNFIATHARRLPKFRLVMEAEVSDLLWDGTRVIGMKVNKPNGEWEVRADLVVGADGRSSTVRQRAGLEVIDYGAPIDVLWFRLPKHASDPRQSFGHVGAGQFMVLLDRGDYWQCAYVIRKGSLDARRLAGLAAFRDEVARCAHYLADRTSEIKDWDDVKLLSVKVDRLREWARDGLLCIGDAAHAMSPVAGVGINLALQDAVAAARILGTKLREGHTTLDDLRAVQERREWPARQTQRMQVFIHEHFLPRIFESTAPIPAPWPAKLLDRFSLLRRLPARMIGMGFRPEHIGGDL